MRPNMLWSCPVGPLSSEQDLQTRESTDRCSPAMGDVNQPILDHSDWKESAGLFFECSALDLLVLVSKNDPKFLKNQSSNVGIVFVTGFKLNLRWWLNWSEVRSWDQNKHRFRCREWVLTFLVHWEDFPTCYVQDDSSSPSPPLANVNTAFLISKQVSDMPFFKIPSCLKWTNMIN